MLVVAGCSGTSAGDPNPAETNATSASTSSTGKSSTSANEDPQDPFKGLVACDLLDEALDQMDDWDFPSGEYDDSGGDNGCGSSIPQEASVGLTLQPGGTLDEFGDDPAKLYDGDIKGRAAVEQRDGYDEGSCSLVMAVGSNNRALVSIVSSKRTRSEACNVLENIARKVEPLLPDQPS